MTRGRKATIAVIFGFAILTGFGAITATWVKRQVLDGDNWNKTSAKLLADDKIQTALGTYLVTQLFDQSEVSSALASVLPEGAQALAAPASAGMQQLALQLAPRLLDRPKVQDAWQKANEVAHAQLVNIIEGGGENVSTENGTVTLNLRPMVDELAQQLGVEDKVNQAREQLNLSEDSGQLVIMKSDQLAAAQDIANGIRSLSIILTIISFGLFALAIGIAQEKRRVTFRAVGWSFFALGLLALLLRRGGGNQIVEGLVRSESVKPAAHDAWNISTELLYSLGIAFVIYGLLLVACAWLVGPMRYAVEARRRLAPVLADEPGTVYGAVGFAYLLVLLWGPTPAFRNLIPIILIACLIAAGVEVLRRQTAEEFPTAREPVGSGPPPKPALAK